METLEQYLARRVQAETPLAEMLRWPPEQQQRLGVAHTAREILQQPWTWRETARLVLEQADALRDFLERDGGITHAVFTGAGSSAYAGLALAPLFRQRCRWHAVDVPTTDLLLGGRDVFVEDRQECLSHYLLVSLARSGDSPESTGTVDRVLREFPAVRHLVLCCNRDGALARKYGDRPNVFTLVLPDATNDQSLVMTSSFSSLVVAGQCVAELVGADRPPGLSSGQAGGLSPQVPGQAGGLSPHVLAQAAECMLDSAAVAQQVAAAGPERICLLAPRALFGMAREGALKLLESTAGRVATVAETFLGFRHGPMAFANERTALLYFFSSEEQNRRYELDLAREVHAKRLGMLSVALGPGEGCAAAGLSLSAVYRHPLPDYYRAPLDVIFAQMLAMFCSLRLGLRPDAPSQGGVIHRVVQGVKLYD